MTDGTWSFLYNVPAQSNINQQLLHINFTSNRRESAWLEQCPLASTALTGWLSSASIVGIDFISCNWKIKDNTLKCSQIHRWTKCGHTLHLEISNLQWKCTSVIWSLSSKVLTELSSASKTSISRFSSETESLPKSRLETLSTYYINRIEQVKNSK